MAAGGGVQIIVDADVTHWEIKMATQIDWVMCSPFKYLLRKKNKNSATTFRAEKAVGAQDTFP